MKNSFLAGLGFLGIVLIITAIMNDWSFLIFLSGGAGLIAFILSAVFLGVFQNGDRNRLDFHIEDKQDRRKRTRTAYLFFLFGLPNILATGIYIYIQQ